MSPEQIEGEAVQPREWRGYRDLISAILNLTNEDCATGGTENAVDAYRWVVSGDPSMRLYCELLGIDPDRFRSAFITKHGQRCERLIVKQIDYEEQLRDEEDAKAHIAGMRAVKAEERYRTTLYNKHFANVKPDKRPPRPVLSDEERTAIYRKAAGAALRGLWDKRKEAA